MLEICYDRQNFFGMTETVRAEKEKPSYNDLTKVWEKFLKDHGAVVHLYEGSEGMTMFYDGDSIMIKTWSLNEKDWKEVAKAEARKILFESFGFFKIRGQMIRFWEEDGDVLFRGMGTFTTFYAPKMPENFEEAKLYAETCTEEF